MPQLALAAQSKQFRLERTHFSACLPPPASFTMSLPDRVRNITLTQWMITLVAFIFVALIILGQRYHFGVTDYIQFILDGLRAGAIYALVAMGFVLVYRVTGVINFAQGAFVMLGPMITI